MAPAFKLKKIAEFLQNPRNFFIVLVLVYVPITHLGLVTVQFQSDENVYFNAARAINDGYMPYKDFFLFHMPLMLYIPAFFFRLLGYFTWVGKLIEIVSSFFVLFFTYLIGEKLKRNCGIVSCLLMLSLSPLFHIYLRSYYGIMLALMPVVMSYYFYIKDKHMLSGLTITLSIFVRLHTIYFFIVLAFLNRKNWRFFKGALLCTPLLVFILVPHFMDYSILYTIKGYHYAPDTKIEVLTEFIAQHWIMLLFYSIGMITLIKERIEKKTSTLLSDWFAGKDHALTIIISSVLFFLFTLIGTKWVRLYYFIFDIPFIAIVGALGFLRILEYKNKIIVPVLIIILAYANLVLTFYGMDSGYSKIVKAYREIISPGAVRILSYVENNTVEGDTILVHGFDPYKNYVSWTSGRRLTDNNFDHKIPNENFDYEFSSALKKKPRLVLIDINSERHLNNLGVVLNKSIDYLEENYHPSDLLDIDNKVVIAWKPNDNLTQKRIIEDPQTTGNIHYFGRVYYEVDGIKRLEEDVFNTTLDSARIFLPQSILGKNPINLSLIADGFLRWPLSPMSRYDVEFTGTRSEVWTLDAEDNEVRLLVYSYQEGELISIAYVILNYEKGVPIKVMIFSGYPERYSKRFYRTYQQVLIPEDLYVGLYEVIDAYKRGDITWLEYNRLRDERFTSDSVLSEGNGGEEIEDG